MPLNLKSAGGGGITLSPASTAVDINVTVPAAAGTLVTTSTFSTLANYANDAAASGGGIPVGGLYRNGPVIQVRVS